MQKLLSNINSPKDLRKLSKENLPQVAEELREFIIDIADEATTNVDLRFGNAATGRIRFDVANDNFEINKDVDFEGNKLVNAEIENLAAAPTCDAASTGRIYINTANNNSFVCNGVLFERINGGGNTIEDTDGNTLVQVEEGVNDDTIRFDTAGTERLTIGATGDFSFPNATNFTLADAVGALNFDSDTFTIDALNNRVGIGTDSPDTKFQVIGQARASSFSVADNAATAPAYRFENDSNTGLYLAAPDTLGFSTGGTLKLEVDADGDVLVGASSETIDTDGGVFVLDGNNLFVADELGVEGAIYTDDTATKYQFLDIFGCVRGSATAGNIGGRSPVVRFDEGNDSQMRCLAAVPDDWVAGTDIDFEVFWTPSDNTAGDLFLEFDYGSFGVGDTIVTASFTDTVLPTQSITASTQGVVSEFTMTVPNTEIALDEMINFRFRRQPDEAADTYAADINVHMIRMAYTGKKLR